MQGPPSERPDLCVQQVWREGGAEAAPLGESWDLLLFLPLLFLRLLLLDSPSL